MKTKNNRETIMANQSFTRAFVLLLAFAMLVMTGCASNPRNPDDPLEGYNRAMFRFNEGVDKAVVKPLAQGYEKAVPELVRTGIGNVFSNLGDVWIGINNLLQGKAGDGMSDLMRFAVNSTFGILGIFDVASEMGLPKHNEDLGQTLAVWGVGEGAYFVVPFLGPRTVRDAVVLPVDMRGNGLVQLDHVPTRNTVLATRVVHTRSLLLGTDRALEEQLDKYAFVRDAYLQARRYQVHDGNPPIEYENFDANGKNSRGPLYETYADALALAAVGRMEFVNHSTVDSAPEIVITR
ncbi:MAG: VacJ family lipoprotein [Pseudazoarcus pumilus]|nr:VacJ family lipoprotein [Pseudazoarcus pumilus]